MKKTFAEIRNEYPSSFLLLINYEQVELPSGEIEITAAEEVQGFETGEEMIEASKKLRRLGKRVMFCGPQSKERLVIERRPSMRVIG